MISSSKGAATGNGAGLAGSIGGSGPIPPRLADQAERLFADLAGRFESATVPLSNGADPTGYYALTEELDAAVDEACANPYLAQNLRGLRVHLTRLRRFSRRDPVRLAASATEHAAIAHALAARNPELAVATTTMHLQHALAHLQSHQAGAPTDQSPGTTAGFRTHHDTHTN